LPHKDHLVFQNNLVIARGVPGMADVKESAGCEGLFWLLEDENLDYVVN